MSAHDDPIRGMARLTLANDLLRGAPAIAAYLGPAFTVRGIYHLADKGALPIFRLPNNTTIYARKSELDAAFSAAARGIEARQGGDAASGSVHESPVGTADAPADPPTPTLTMGESE